MAEEKKSLLERLRARIFGGRDANRADQEERRDQLTTFLSEREDEREQRVADAREKRARS